MDKEYKVVKLSDGTKWLTVASTNYNNVKYQYLIQVNEEETDFYYDKQQVMKRQTYQGKDYLDIVTDKEVLKEVVPLLIPETKPYIDSPEKLKELMNEIKN